MNEHPILFSGPMVRAILDGRKTMTRRVIKDNCPFVTGAYFDEETERWYWTTGAERERLPTDLCLGKCPYGQPGDQLWVRETWLSYRHLHKNGRDEALLIYRADGEDLPKQARGTKWRPSIFMPRWASRITLEITAVRVERVQDIGDEDAEAEGLSWCNAASPRDKFQCLWNSLNAKRGYGWEANPWVWVIAFKRVK